MPRQGVKVFGHFRHRIRPHILGALVVISFGSTKPPAHPEDGDGVSA